MKKKHPAKKHAAKKHLTKKYFTKTFVKTHIIPISAIGVLVGATVITLSVYFGVTSCKSNPIPSDAKAIDSSIDNKYIVQYGTNIRTSATTSIANHNKLLDLESYVSDKGINTSNFVIEGEINFGILVNFDENINLYGDSKSLISLGTQDSPLTTDVYGIIVGSTSVPTASDGVYRGKMHIANSVNVLLNTTSIASGIYFGYIENKANIIVDGTFTISSSLPTPSVYGVQFSGNTSGGTIDISGIFVINAVSLVFGVHFDGVYDTKIDISGVFIVNSDTQTASGVYFYGITEASNINISGVFIVMSDSMGYFAYGIAFSGELRGGNTNIGGAFTISGETSYGVLFGESVNNANIKIGGAFTLYSTELYFNGDVRGIRFSSNVINGTIDIYGMFALAKASYIGYALGIDFADTATHTATWNSISNPQFFGFKDDSSNLLYKYPTAQYKWNGQQINSTTPSTIADSSLEIKPVVAQGNSDFSINVIETTLQQPGNDYNQNIFNNEYKNELKKYIKNHNSCPANVKGWLKDIINQIPFK